MIPLLRVLHVISGDLWAGAEAQAFTLMSNLAKMPEIAIAAVVLNDGILAAMLRSAEVPVHVLDESKLSSLAIFARLRALLKAWEPDIVHTHRIKENIIGSIANWTYRSVPCVRTVHGGNERASKRGLKAAFQFSTQALDRWCGGALQQRIIAVTRDLGERLAGEFPAQRVVVIENGVDASQVRAARGVPEFRVSAPEAIHVGIVGRLVPVKRLDIFLQMASLLKRNDESRNWQFHAFGDGPLLPDLKLLARDFGIANAVKFHGHRKDIATCISGLDVLVICSDHEGLPMVALEALALEVPTIAHSVGGLADVVPREFLVSQHDPEGYVAATRRALCEDGRRLTRENMSARLPEFSALRNATRMRSLYEGVITEGVGRRK